MMHFFRLAALAAVATTSAAPAAASPAQQAPAAAESTPPLAKKEKVICKRQQRIGSLIASTRVCLTAKEWDKAQVGAQEMARGAINSCGGASDSPQCRPSGRGFGTQAPGSY